MAFLSDDEKFGGNKMGKTRIRLALAVTAIPAAVGLAIAAPAMALADTETEQGQQAGTSQDATSTTVAPQYSDASNVAVLSDGGVRSDPNNATSEARNASNTDQTQGDGSWLHRFWD